MKIFELTPTNGRKSFGGKAKVIEQDGVASLLSYETIVATLDLESREYIINGEYSPTTKSHLKAFENFYSL